MAFNYNKNSQSHQGNDSFWTSYSDLFLGLSTIFLLLYVTASLRTSTDAIKQQMEGQKMRQHVEELENQLKTYESIKNNYLQTSAPKDEQQEYQELMDKLTLLQEDAKNEKNSLLEQAQENDKKAKALNKYQQMVRNIMNANKVAKTRIITRDDVIGEQDTEIDTQKKNISSLQQDINTKSQIIQDNNRKIALTEKDLKNKMADLKKAFEHNKLTRKAYEKQIAAVRQQDEKAIQNLRSTTVKYSQQIVQANKELTTLNTQLNSTQLALNTTQNELGQTKNVLGQTQNELGQTKNVLGQTKNELGQTKNALGQTQQALGQTQQALSAAEMGLAQKQAQAAALEGKINNLRAGFAAEQAKARGAFENELKKHKMGLAEQQRREGEFRAGAAKREKEMQGRLAGLQGQLSNTEGDLARAREEMDTRRAVAKDIKDTFAKAGVKADIDMKTGEVVLDFGDAYFANDSAALNTQMKDILERAMPAYSKSLFGNPKLANKITAVEVIGFASPTYKGRFIDPNSDKADDRTALKYNMDLSYRRANSIFQHVVDNKTGDFPHQKQLMGLMKVSGRSFLEVLKMQGRNPADAAEFCKVNDCRKTQRVIVRFSMDGKK